ncbi:serine/threonine-protein kinase [Salinactinospora qingdaonensis]|uniref:Protein kinase domain-containing protein n=1 Tax=Salinactinospora qingdaonensis TaxID=702744 RepID=A0ABP7FR19_9ACTN
MSRRAERTVSVLVPPDLAPLANEDPRTIGPYVLIGRVNSGRAATVYAAVDPAATGDATVVAVKVPHAAYPADEAVRAELDRRLRALTGVDGRGYVRPIAFDANARVPWLAMPFVPGVMLEQYVRKRGALSDGRLVALGAGLAESLATLHRFELAHGDLKPGNVVLTSSGPRVLDCALPGDALAPPHAAAWTSPERLRGGPPTAAGDVFAWGAVVAFASTGRLPFGEQSGDGPDLAGVNAELEPLVRDCLSPTPDDRPTARELLEAVGAVGESLSSEVAGATPVAGTSITRVLAREWRGIVEPAGLPRVVRLDGKGAGGTSGTGRPGGRLALVAGGVVLAVVVVGGATWAGVAAMGGPPEAAPSSSPSTTPTSTPTESTTPEGPRTALVRFEALEQPNPVQGPWVYTEVERSGVSPEPSPGAEQLTPEQFSSGFVEVAESSQPSEAYIAPDAEVMCAQFCLSPGQVSSDPQGRGTYEVTGQDFINYLGWGQVVIAEVEFAAAGEETPGASGTAPTAGTSNTAGASPSSEVPEIVRITEIFTPSQ